MLVLAVAGSGLARADLGDDQEQLAAMELRCAKALVNADTRWLSGFYGADWFLVGSDGRRFTREQTLADLATGELKWHSCKFTDMEVHIFGDTAVVVYKADALGAVHGLEIREIEICSDTFVRGDEGWRCLHSHNSPAP